MAHAAAWATLDEARSVAKINGHKSQRRRQQAILGTIYDSIGNNPPTQTRVDEITEAVKRMDIQLDHIAEGYQHLTMIGSKTAEEYEAATEAVEAEHLPARTTARNIVERHEQRLRMQQQQQPQQQQQAPERAREVKLIGEMKPDTLHRQATPVELRYWLKCFRDYHRASHMDAAPADQQQRYMLALMDEPLRGDMLVELGEDTPIWPAEGAPNDNNTCVGVLKSLFERSYPIAQRRQDYLTAKPPQGTHYARYMATFEALAREADLDNFGPQDIRCHMIIMRCPDAQLKQRLLRIQPPDFTRIMEVIKTDEAETSQMAVGSSSPATAAAVRDKPGRKRSDGGGRDCRNNRGQPPPRRTSPRPAWSTSRG